MNRVRATWQAFSRLSLLNRILLVLLLAAFVLFAFQMVHKVNRPDGNDFTSYLNSARALASGNSPYLTGTPFPYIYPATLAFLLMPLSWLPDAVMNVLWPVANLLALVMTVQLCDNMSYLGALGGMMGILAVIALWYGDWSIHTEYFQQFLLGELSAGHLRDESRYYTLRSFIYLHFPSTLGMPLIGYGSLILILSALSWFQWKHGRHVLLTAAVFMLGILLISPSSQTHHLVWIIPSVYLVLNRILTREHPLRFFERCGYRWCCSSGSLQLYSSKIIFRSILSGFTCFSCIFLQQQTNTQNEVTS